MRELTAQPRKWVHTALLFLIPGKPSHNVGSLRCHTNDKGRCPQMSWSWNPLGWHKPCSLNEGSVFEITNQQGKSNLNHNEMLMATINKACRIQCWRQHEQANFHVCLCPSKMSKGQWASSMGKGICCLNTEFHSQEPHTVEGKNQLLRVGHWLHVGPHVRTQTWNKFWEI